jgi:hypothetical protein
MTTKAFEKIMGTIFEMARESGSNGLVFNREEFYDKADVVLTLGTQEKQYLFEVDR